MITQTTGRLCFEAITKEGEKIVIATPQFPPIDEYQGMNVITYQIKFDKKER